MNRLIGIHRRFKSNLLLIAGVALSLYFSYHTLFGARSYAHLLDLNTQLTQIEKDHEAVIAERTSLESNVKMLRPESLSADLLEERVRYVLGYKRPDEYAVFRN
jgi:cell division protein FtsB